MTVINLFGPQTASGGAAAAGFRPHAVQIEKRRGHALPLASAARDL